MLPVGARVKVSEIAHVNISNSHHYEKAQPLSIVIPSLILRVRSGCRKLGGLQDFSATTKTRLTRMRILSAIQPINNSIKLQEKNMNNLIETDQASMPFGISASKSQLLGWKTQPTKLAAHDDDNILAETVHSPLTTHYSLKKAAFTLAEVLITLGIIGVVAALTLPTVIKHYKAMVLENAFKKSVTNLYQAYDLTRQQLGVDNIYQTYVICTSKENCYDENSLEFRKTLEKNLKVTSIYKQGFYPLKNYNGTKLITINAGLDYPEATKILADGSSFGMNTNSDGVAIATIHIFIDTNGPYKGPNQIGHDLFKFDIARDSKLKPLKMIKLYTEEELENQYYPDLAGYPCSIKSKQASNGMGCSYYAMNNINPDDNTKKYWESLP